MATICGCIVLGKEKKKPTTIFHFTPNLFMHSCLHLTNKCISGYKALEVQCQEEEWEIQKFSWNLTWSHRGPFPWGRNRCRIVVNLHSKIHYCYIYLYLGENEWGFGMPYLRVGFCGFFFLNLYVNWLNSEREK